MQLIIALLVISFVAIWALALAFLTGTLSPSLVSALLPGNPESLGTGEFGAAVAIGAALLASIGIAMTLVLLLRLWNEQKRMVGLQAEQSETFMGQVHSQHKATLVNAYSTRLYGLEAEVERQQRIIARLKQIQNQDPAEKMSEKRQKQLENARRRLKSLHTRVRDYESKIETLLSELDITLRDVRMNAQMMDHSELRDEYPSVTYMAR